jgi:hypothetical protein
VIVGAEPAASLLPASVGSKPTAFRARSVRRDKQTWSFEWKSHTGSI